MIRDRIVSACQNKRIREALFRANKLDLESAITICRAAESARDSMRRLYRDLRNSSRRRPASAADRRMRDMRHCTRAPSVYCVRPRMWHVSQQGPFRQMVPR
jgi:sigma54-dependent transcription regulator